MEPPRIRATGPTDTFGLKFDFEATLKRLVPPGHLHEAFRSEFILRGLKAVYPINITINIYLEQVSPLELPRIRTTARAPLKLFDSNSILRPP